MPSFLFSLFLYMLLFHNIHLITCLYVILRIERGFKAVFYKIKFQIKLGDPVLQILVIPIFVDKSFVFAKIFHDPERHGPKTNF